MTTNSASQNQDKLWMIIFVAWLLACVSFLGSMFFSDVMKFPPCVFCWYQRICMYPLVVIFAAGLFPLNRDVFKFSFPLVCLGLFFALYHNLLYYKIIPESAAPCSQGVPCSTVYINWLGFINIPFLSLVSFSILFVLLLYFRKLNNLGQKNAE